MREEGNPLVVVCLVGLVGFCVIWLLHETRVVSSGELVLRLTAAGPTVVVGSVVVSTLVQQVGGYFGMLLTGLRSDYYHPLCLAYRTKEESANGIDLIVFSIAASSSSSSSTYLLNDLSRGLPGPGVANA
ncbi:unnamed protein product [Laminaria digitata]